MTKSFFGVKTTSPKISTKPELLKRLVNNGMRRVINVAKKDMEKVTATWNNKPEFKIISSTKSNILSVSVQTNDKIFKILSLGSPRHPIRAVNAAFLVFRSGYKAKTIPNKLTSVQGGEFGKLIRVFEVDHPGHKARNYHKLIAERMRDKLLQANNDALRQYLQQVTLPAGR